MSRSGDTFHEEKNQENYNQNAEHHSKLGLDSTLYLAYRDIPELLEKHLFSKQNTNQFRILDFGCGAGLSTEKIADMTNRMGYTTEIVGIDINNDNINLAKQRLPCATFCRIKENDTLSDLGKFDLVICNFVLVEMKSDRMTDVLKKIQSLLDETGVAIVTNCASKAYRHGKEWYTFNSNFDENIPRGNTLSKSNLRKFAEDQPIKVQVFASHGSNISFTFFDFFHSGSAYRKAYENAGLSLLETHKPVGKQSDGINWKMETLHSPYKIHVLAKSSQPQQQLKIKSSL